MKRSCVVLVTALVATAGGAYADDKGIEDPSPLRGEEFTPSYNDFGSTGLMQMPSARFHDDGEFAVGMSHTWPYYRYFLTLQAFPGLESTFRYTQIQNRKYATWSDQQDKDRGVDLKLRLVEEGRYLPQIAVGLRDVAGTGLFSSEYVMASRRWYNFDFTTGIAWGNAGHRGNIPNPFAAIIPGMETRARGLQGAKDLGGNLHANFFMGERASIFGGVEYHTPIAGLRLKLEYDGNDYQLEPQLNNQRVTLPINFGLEYAPFESVNLGAGLERGTEFMLRATLHANFNKSKGIPKFAEKVPVVAARPAPEPKPQDASTVPAAFSPAPPSPIPVQNLAVRDDVLEVSLDAREGMPSARDAAAHALAVGGRAGAPDRVRVVAKDGATAVAEITFSYDELVRSKFLTGEPTAMLPDSARSWVVRDARREAELGNRRPSPVLVAATDAAAQPSPLDRPLPEAVQQRIANEVFAALKTERMTGLSLSVTAGEAILNFSNDGYSNPAKAVGRAAKIVHNHLPASVEQITLIVVEEGMPISRVTVMRGDIERMAAGKGSPQEVYVHAQVRQDDGTPPPDEPVVNADAYPSLAWGLSPNLRQHVGGPENFYFYQVYASASASAKLAPGLKVAGSIGQNLTNNFEDLNLESKSKLPHVRSDVKDYLKGQETWIDDFHVSYVRRLAPSVYGRISAGLFEQMYGAVGGEILYYPAGSSWALAGDLNQARQRDFTNPLGFRDYDITTGHLSYYQKLPFFQTSAVLRAGRYLAGDVGVTAELSRTFENGITIGLFATKTNVSSVDFGEGSFDKGVMLSIPLDIFSTTSTRTRGYFLFRPLTRDGGQALGIPDRLYPIVNSGDASAIDRGWDDLNK